MIVCQPIEISHQHNIINEILIEYTKSFTYTKLTADGIKTQHLAKKIFKKTILWCSIRHKNIFNYETHP